MKFLSKFIVLFLLSGCSSLESQPENRTWYDFASNWRGYYTLESHSDILWKLQKEFKVSTNYITFKKGSTSSSDEDNGFLSYQISYIHSSSDTEFYFSLYPAYETQEYTSARIRFTKQVDGRILVTYYDGSYSEPAYYNYTKSETLSE